MTKRNLIRSNFITTLILVVGFVFIIYIDSMSYYEYAKKNIEQLSEITATNVSNEITKSINQMVDVSHSMSCNDFFIKRLMNRNSYNYKEDLQSYLSDYYQSYGFDSVFLISAMTNNYYTQNGIIKQVSPDDEHDIWFYNFVRDNRTFDVEIDTDNLDHSQINLYVNYRISDPNGKLLGVIGVADRFDDYQNMVKEMEDKYGLSIYLVNKGTSLNSYISDTDLFVSEQEITNLIQSKEPVQLNRSDEMNARWYYNKLDQTCVYSKYEPNLQCEVVILKNGESFYKILYKRVFENFSVLFIIMIICGVLINVVLYLKDKKIILRENTDELTGLLNRKLFSNIACSNYQNYSGNVIFMLDVDDFKMVNDTEGHLFGNNILQMIGEELRLIVNNQGIVGRWGGDEFIGILRLSEQEAFNLLTELMSRVSKRSARMDYPLTLSVGLSKMYEKTLEKDMSHADQALYISKANGKGKITIYSIDNKVQ